MSDAADILYGGASAPTPSPATSPAAKSAAETLYCQTPEPAAPAPAPAPTPATPPAASTVSPAVSPAGDGSSAKPEAAVADDAVAPAELAKITVDDVRAAVPSDIADARKADVTRRLFGDRERDALAESLPMDSMQGVAPETVAAIRTEVAEMALDAGATAADISVFTSAMQQVKANPLTDEQRIASRHACVDAFNEAFGQDARKTLELTRQWVQADPRRNALLAPVGDNPQIALLAARLALAAQRRR